MQNLNKSINDADKSTTKLRDNLLDAKKATNFR